MKRLLLIIFAIFLVVSPVQGEFFKDIIVTSPTGIWTDSRAYSTLSDAVAAIGASEQDLYIAKEETVTTLIIPANIRLRFVKAGAIANSNTLTINTKNIHADHQIFTGAGAVNFAPGSEVRSTWFADFETAITQTANDTVTLLVDKANTLLNSAAVGDNVLLKWNASNLITIAAGQTLSNIGGISAPDLRLFTVSGSVAFKNQSPLTTILASWFGNSVSTLDIADNAAAAAGKELRITYAYTIDDDVTLTAPKISIQPNVPFAIATTKTLTIGSRNLDAGLYQIFACTGTGDVKFSVGAVDSVKPEWWGAVADGLTNSTAAIQAACSSLPATKGGVINFAVGNYLITPGQIVISTPGTVLQGKASASDGLGNLAGTALISAVGTGKMISFLGSAAATPLDSCQINNISLDGQEKVVQGLSLKWVSNFRSLNLWVSECFDDGVYMEQVWDSSFYDLEIEGCGAQGTGKVGLHIYNGTAGNCNNLRFYSFHAEVNYGDDVWIDSSAAGIGTGGNHNILFIGGKCEKSQDVGTYSTKAFKISGYDGVNGFPNQGITIQNVMIAEYMVAGDIGIHFAGDGYMTVNNCLFTNNIDGGTGIKVEGPVRGPQTHLITNNNFNLIAQEITIDTTTCPRNRVWTDMNSNSYYLDTDSRIHINSDLVLDRRRFVLASSGVDVGTSGTGEDTLGTCTLPASLLGTTGSIKIEASGYVTGAAGNKTIKLYWGGDTITVFPAGVIANYQGWKLEATIQISGLTGGNYWLTWKFTLDGAPSVVSSGWAGANEDTTVDVTIKTTGECADGADAIHQAYWRVVEE